jgi:predicted nucleic acid-binding protein
VRERGSDVVRDRMQTAEVWFTCRVAFVEVHRAIATVAGAATAQRFVSEWSAFGVVEVDQQLVESAAALTVATELRSLDAIHLAAALVLPRDDLVLATWDRRLHSAARAEGVDVVPERLA